MKLTRRNVVQSTFGAAAMCASGTAFAQRAKRDEEASVLAVGDLILDIERPERFFAASAPTLRRGDIVLGNVESPHTLVDNLSNPEARAAAPVPPERLDCLKAAGFNMASVVGNHAFDQGVAGIRDTLAKLRELDIAPAGAGMNIFEARKPALAIKKGIRFALLGYNAVGPDLNWATPKKAGSAYVRVITTYVNDRATPGGPPTAVFTQVDPASLHSLAEDVKAAREIADFVIVAFHTGRGYDPEILTYQKQLGHVSIDAGASMVVCAHTHALLGVESYRGKPVFHGLGNFVTLTDDFMPTSSYADQWNHFPLTAVETRPIPPAGFVRGPMAAPGSIIPFYPFDQASRNTMIAKAVVTKSGLVEARFIPCFLDDTGAPVPLNRSNGGQGVLDHVIALTSKGGLKTRFEWTTDGQEVVVLPG